MNYWSENGDVLVHENRGTRAVGCVLVAVGTAIIPFIAKGWVAVAACVMLWTVFGMGAMTTAVRVEFNRRAGTMWQRNVLGLKWTERLHEFVSVRLVRAITFRGNPQIRVNLKRADRIGDSGSGEYLVATYAWPGGASEKEAREWGGRLARFLKIPLDDEL